MRGKKKVEQDSKFVKENKLEAVERKKFIDDAVKHAGATKNEKK